MLSLQEQIRKQSEIPRGFLFGSLAKWAAIQPHNVYIVEAESGRTLTYAQALTAVNSM